MSFQKPLPWSYWPLSSIIAPVSGIGCFQMKTIVSVVIKRCQINQLVWRKDKGRFYWKAPLYFLLITMVTKSISSSRFIPHFLIDEQKKILIIFNRCYSSINFLLLSWLQTSFLFFIFFLTSNVFVSFYLYEKQN